MSSTSAPTLNGIGSRHGSPGCSIQSRLKAAHYFGNTRHAKGEMAGFVADNLKELDDADQSRLKAVIAALSAEAALPSQIDADKAAASDGTLAKGRKAHGRSVRVFFMHGLPQVPRVWRPGEAPDLTGWASKDWLVRFITDPTQEAFYRETNDRMPAFGKASGATTQPLLTVAEIELLARYLRGEL